MIIQLSVPLVKQSKESKNSIRDLKARRPGFESQIYTQESV